MPRPRKPIGKKPAVADLSFRQNLKNEYLDEMSARWFQGMLAGYWVDE
jgi:hypothetical protein